MTFIKAFRVCLLAVFTALLFKSSTPIMSLLVIWFWVAIMCLVVKDFVRIRFRDRTLTLSIGLQRQGNTQSLPSRDVPEST
ncbi:hypothetical protein [Kushneria indalinina]|uniref:Uncharacterized protein n=1 Tax=Kushneria indalinina DSM 14324 TaxID=1122140 RepID=A0A3D9DRN6_9GAMM|nr:hypothetical protein [Kushneria indalinina]REC93380.1 hypothetical protein C8D72_3425 [Kushneria indalinina DSM 14324]